MRDFRKYRVWQDAIVIANSIYKLTQTFPKAEIYGLSSQIQRAAVSIASNIAEGSSRTSTLEFTHFLEIAIGSAFETETQLLIAYNLHYISQDDCEKLLVLVQSEEKQINTFIQSLKANGQQPMANSQS